MNESVLLSVQLNSLSHVTHIFIIHTYPRNCTIITNEKKMKKNCTKIWTNNKKIHVNVRLNCNHTLDFIAVVVFITCTVHAYVHSINYSFIHTSKNMYLVYNNALLPFTNMSLWFSCINSYWSCRQKVCCCVFGHTKRRFD